jgi:hypothetical protein
MEESKNNRNTSLPPGVDERGSKLNAIPIPMEEETFGQEKNKHQRIRSKIR